MNKRELAELLKYSHPKQLYVVNWENILHLLHCPFKAIVKHDIGVLKKGELVAVDEVKVSTDIITVFIIQNQAYYFWHFEIVIDE